MEKKKTERKYRHEYKFLIDARQKAVLYSRIKNLIPVDSHAGENDTYWIRSVYFDDMFDSCFNESEDGINERAKYRIRIYNVEGSRISLERKTKKNGMVCKESAKLTRSQCDSLIAGKAFPIEEDMPEVLKQFLVLMLTKGFRPKAVIEYERIPFIYKDGNVRITFDDNITSSLDTDRFFERDNVRYPILAKGQSLLEVKFDEYLPSFIKNNLEIGSLMQTSFSKYYLGRKYTINSIGGRKK